MAWSVDRGGKLTLSTGEHLKSAGVSTPPPAGRYGQHIKSYKETFNGKENPIVPRFLKTL